MSEEIIQINNPINTKKNNLEKTTNQPKRELVHNLNKEENEDNKLRKELFKLKSRTKNLSEDKILGELRELIIDLTKEGRKINTNIFSEILQDIIDKKNSKANIWLKDFQKRFNEKKEKEIKKTQKKCFGTNNIDIIQKAIRDALNNLTDPDNKSVKKWKEYSKAKDKSEQTTKEKIIKTFLRIYGNKIFFHEGEDIDKTSCKLLLKLANIKYKTTNLEQGSETDQAGLYIDFGGTDHGIEIKTKKQTENKIASLFNSTMILSEHPKDNQKSIDTPKTTSSAFMLKKLLFELGAINKKYEPQLNRFINFVNKVDSLDYQVSGIDYENNHQTLFGLHHQLPIEFIYEYFKNEKNTGFEILDDKYIKRTGIKVKDKFKGEVSLKDYSNLQKQRIEKNKENFMKIEGEGYFMNFFKGNLDERFIIDIGGKIKDGPQIATYHDVSLLKIFPSGDLYIYSPRKLPKRIGGELTNENFLIIKNINKENLKKILDEFSDKGGIIKSGIKEEILNFIDKKPTTHKPQTKTKEQVKIDLSTLPKLEFPQLEIGKTYNGIINNMFNTYGFVTIDSNKKLNGILHKKNLPENINIKDFKQGQEIKVILKEKKQEGEKIHLTFSMA